MKTFGMNDISNCFHHQKYVVDMVVIPGFKFQKMSYEDGAKSPLGLLKEKLNYMIITDWYHYMMKNIQAHFSRFIRHALKNTICGGIECLCTN
jgi:hypothetical protein